METTTAPSAIRGKLDFLWLELTNRCNLECTHCYAGSSPYAAPGLMSLEDYREILEDAAAQGCREVQFIGGEPTLHLDLPALIALADGLGFSMIEVYTNLVRLPEALLRCFVDHRVHVATSIYSATATVHDIITTREGSWAKTVQNLKSVVESGLQVRVGIIEMEANRGETPSTIVWLKSLGIENVGADRERGFGRAQRKEQCSMGDLCGECSKGTLCVGPDGTVAPCIMSKAWPVGSLSRDSFRTIVNSDELAQTRQRIHENTIAVRELDMGGCNPDRKNRCSPDTDGANCSPCSPKINCGPNDCRPKHQ